MLVLTLLPQMDSPPAGKVLEESVESDESSYLIGVGLSLGTAIHWSM